MKVHEPASSQGPQGQQQQNQQNQQNTNPSGQTAYSTGTAQPSNQPSNQSQQQPQPQTQGQNQGQNQNQQQGQPQAQDQNQQQGQPQGQNQNQGQPQGQGQNQNQSQNHNRQQSNVQERGADESASGNDANGGANAGQSDGHQTRAQATGTTTKTQEEKAQKAQTAAQPESAINSETKPQQGEGQGVHHVLNSGRSTMVQDIRNAITAKYNQIFMLTSHTGDILKDMHGYGVYFHDTEYLDQIEMKLNGKYALSLLADASDGAEPIYELTNPDLSMGQDKNIAKERVSIYRRYKIEDELQHELNIRNMDKDAIEFDLTLEFSSHFTNMFVVRGAQPGERGTLHQPQVEGKNKIVLAYDGADKHLRTSTITFTPAPDALDGGKATYHIALDPHATLHIMMTIALRDKGPAAPWEKRLGKEHIDNPDGATQHKVFQQELGEHPQISTNNDIFNRALGRSFDDIRMLAIANHGDVYIAAGVPWYVALFGRDSCISAFQTLAYNSALARTTLHVLAGLQGYEFNAFQDEEPGKILHELRVGEKANLDEVPQIPYYGTVDATPLWLLLMADYVRWTGDTDTFKQLEGNIERALTWCDENPTRYNHQKFGFLRYGSKSKQGLANQGWKDSGNSIVNNDGSLCQQPIALVAVQGYVYRAKVRLASVYRAMGNSQKARQLEKEAEDLRKRFNQTFWQQDINFYALCLQKDDRPSTAIASNPGQALFGGIVDVEHAQAVAQRLMQEDMFNGWGIRTLSANEKAYNPLDYQVGSIWPHDNSLIAMGLWQYRQIDAMEKVFNAIFDAASNFRHYRLPEVFDGFSQKQYDRPVHYPVACSPQAWAAGALPLLLHAALGLDAHALEKRLFISRPHLPRFMSNVTVSGLRVGQAKVDLHYQSINGTTYVAVTKRQGDLEVLIEY